MRRAGFAPPDTPRPATFRVGGEARSEIRPRPGAPGAVASSPDRRRLIARRTASVDHAGRPYRRTRWCQRRASSVVEFVARTIGTGRTPTLIAGGQEGVYRGLAFSLGGGERRRERQRLEPLFRGIGKLDSHHLSLAFSVELPPELASAPDRPDSRSGMAAIIHLPPRAQPTIHPQ